MNIYSQKQVWKLILSVIALVIVGLSLWYTSVLVNNIAEKERTQVRLWAEAIRKKAKLVKYTNELFTKLSNEERKKVELWAEATKRLASSDNTNDYTFVLKVVADNTTVPVILADGQGEIISYRNLDPEKAKDPAYLKDQIREMASFHDPIEISIYGLSKNYLYYKDSRLFSELKKIMDDLIESFISEVVINSASAPVIFTDHTRKNVISYGNIDSSKIDDPAYISEMINSMKKENDPIEIDLGEGKVSYIFYKDSSLLTQLKFYPIIQFGIISLFILIAYWLFSTARKAEQNQVWVGMAKETAHQLGTPLSSLLAWMELLKSKGVDQATLKEINKDISRLETITDRFSKIGSSPKLQNEDVELVLKNAIHYIKSRSSNKINFSIRNKSNTPVHALINIPLFEWVIENLCKNAIDAMEGSGSITLEVNDQTQHIYIDIRDTGKGVPSSKFKTIFEPGYTSKQRGWGLGLSLTKRIIENYHNGKIFVKDSEPGKGTTFRIVLDK